MYLVAALVPVPVSEFRRAGWRYRELAMLQWSFIGDSTAFGAG